MGRKTIVKRIDTPKELVFLKRDKLFVNNQRKRLIKKIDETKHNTFYEGKYLYIFFIEYSTLIE